MASKGKSQLKLAVYSRQDRFLNHGLSLFLGELLGSCLYKEVMDQSIGAEAFHDLFLSARDPERIDAGEPVTRHVTISALGQIETQIPAIRPPT